MDPETTPATTPDTTPTDAAAEALTALDQGIEAAADPTAPSMPPEAPAKDDSVTPPADDQKPVDDKPPGAEPTQAEKDAAAQAEADKAAQPDKAVEDEITALGLKEKAAERFRNMAGEIKELAPIREQLKAAGITDVAQLPQVIERARQAEDLVAMVMETGATPEQYGGALDYMKLVNLARGGNLQAAEAAYEVIGKEYAALAQALGKEVPGVFDPLAAHKDLQAELEAGDITRERALEVAAQRNKAALQQHAREQGAHHQEKTVAQQRAVEQGRAALADFDKEMMAADPTYVARRAALSAAVAEIRASHPPHEWASRAAIALAKIPVPTTASAAAPAGNGGKPPPGPMRPGPVRGNLQPTTDDPLEAMEQGIEEASHR